MAVYVKSRIGLLIVLMLRLKVIETTCNATNRFGSDCKFFCHCMNNTLCDPADGYCSQGCDFEWVGPACQRKNIVLSESGIIAKHKNNISPIQFAYLAVDKSLSTCSMTQNTREPYWRLWLPSKYSIFNISIATERNYLDYFKEFQVIVENNTKSWSRYNYSHRDICYKHNNAAPVSTSINIACNKTLIGNQVRILLKSSPAQLVLCDVRIYGDCDDGTFGASCTDRCSSHCKGKCDKDNGTCESCEPGWTESRCTKECYETTAANYNGTRNTTVDGTKCQRWDVHVPHTHSLDRTGIFPDNTTTEAANYCRDPDGEGSLWCFTINPDIRWQFCGIDTCHSECNDGTYGVNCTRTCSRRCKNSTCSKLNGVCNEGCIPGFKGRYCNNLCDDGKYGENCIKSCSVNCMNITACRKTDGICADGCNPGYRGEKCDQTCLSNFYGIKCKQKCSAFCFPIESEHCNVVNGSCLHGCKAGWQGLLCDKKCSSGLYGLNCSKECSPNCKNGSCSECKPGLEGKMCEKGSRHLQIKTKWSVNTWDDRFFLGAISA